jgi:hypothetical protein
MRIAHGVTRLNPPLVWAISDAVRSLSEMHVKLHTGSLHSGEIDMEHRWGRRASLWTAVQLRSEHEGASGRVRDASASGAFVETRLRATPGSRIDIEFRGAWIAASVVRTDEDGIGLEWYEFAPAAIVETLERLHELRELLADPGRNLPRVDRAVRRPSQAYHPPRKAAEP